MSLFYEAMERIQFATNTRTQVELAGILEIRQSSISDAKRRKSLPADWYLKLFDKFGLNPDWLRFGVGPMYLRTDKGYVPQEMPATGVSEEPAHYGDPGAKSTIANVFSMSSCTKSGKKPLEMQSESKLSLASPFVGPEICILRMNAHNMEPVVRYGAYLGIDTKQTRPVSGSMFVLYTKHEGLHVRRLFLDEDNDRFLLRSDAPNYPESSVSIADMADRLVGQVRWVLQELA